MDFDVQYSSLYNDVRLIEHVKSVKMWKVHDFQEKMR